MPCAHCSDVSILFDDRRARRDLKRYRRRGPAGSTKWLIDAVRSRIGKPLTLLDIGGGIGTIPDALSDVMQKGTGVDASTAYLSVARELADERGFGDRMAFIEGDFVETAPAIDSHDVVTLDRVLCCYPDLDELVTQSASRARALYAIVVPCVHWYTRISFPLLNLGFRLKRSAFRVYLHETDAIDAAVRRSGLEFSQSRRGVLWQTRIYVRR